MGTFGPLKGEIVFLQESCFVSVSLSPGRDLQSWNTPVFLPHCQNMFQL